ncbi:MAG: 23S rRNA (pseudouridine(1915)-N(3))-methyltransferase RlmH [Candidatus Aenigmarchaeota archaeon]|nr:23S rRNA (pseudouridine(1915)-N(3))-methyltransferase RlmH [Candidatus Aenigmarchaeota archaeon]
MRKIRIIAIGKLSKPYRELETEFLKRLKNVEVIEIKESNKFEETKTIAKKLEKTDCHILVCDNKGEEMNSKEFSDFLLKLLETKDVCFVVGGPDGIVEEFLSHLKIKKISFSKMVFNHQLFRIILLEQIYRALMMVKNHPYSRH